jgi:hypothetical protein
MQLLALNAVSMLVALVLASSCSKPVVKKDTDVLKEMAYGHLLARSIHEIAYFKVADDIDGATSLAVIAKRRNLDHDALGRVMNVLVNHGIFVRNDKGFLEHTSLSAPLKSNSEKSLQAAFAKECDERRWSSIGRIDIALTRGTSPFHSLYGEGFYEYLEKNKAAADLFNAGMSGFSEQEARVIAAEFDFAPYGTIFDIGGGNGGLLREILNKNAAVQGHLFDLKDAVESSPLLKDPAFLGRAFGHVGDFFAAIPHGGDLYIIKRVLHNWDDEHSLTILQKAHKAIAGRSQARVLVIEKILPKNPDGSLLVDTDLIGLAFGDGRERTEEEFTKLGAKAGMELESVHPTSSGVSVMVFKTMVP